MDGTKRVVMSLALGTVGAMTRGVLPALGAACVLVAASHAGADVKSVPTRFVVVVKDNSALRCADAGIYYSVRMLNAGEILKIDGEGGGWLRAEYPAGTRAFVVKDDAMYDATGGTVKLVRASKLRAANEKGASSWSHLLEQDLAAGTTFPNAQVVKLADGTTDGYLVPAPPQARGYIRAEMVRPAGAEEAAKYGAPSATTAAPKTVETPKQIATAAAPQNSAETKPAQPAGSGPEGAAAKATDSKPNDAPTTLTMTSARATGEPAQPKPDQPKPELTKRVDDLDALRGMFDRVMRGSENDAEVQTAISEFNRKIDGMPTTGDEGKIRTALENRREALKLRLEIVQARREANETGGMDERMRAIHLAVEQANRQANYTVVGRMLPSTVYDGYRGMALMYRIESADMSSARTVGYVVPREGIDLLPKMGKIVGIVGETRMDPALGLNLVAPTRIDELQVVGGKLEMVPGTTPGTTISPPAPATPGKPADPDKKGQPAAASDAGDTNK